MRRTPRSPTLMALALCFLLLLTIGLLTRRGFGKASS